MRWTDPVDGRPRRHARVWLGPATWRSALTSPLDPDRVAALDAWIAADRAVVARRREPASGEAYDLAVALPLAADRLRIGFTVAPQAILRIAPPLTLAETIPSAPADWQAPLADLAGRASRIGTTFHVYGSLAWQAISGEDCVRAGSDVDLLWTADSVAGVARVLALLAAWEADAALRADGELLLRDGDAIAWRELTRPADRVLVKHQDRVSLQPSPAHWHDRLHASVPAA